MSHPVRDPIIDFLRGIGLTVEERTLAEPTFLPGLQVEGGALFFDPGKLAHPGDLLHEAGHLAVLPVAERGSLSNHLGDDGGLEMAAIAWSYAACMFLGLPAEVVFHAEGYRGGSCSLMEAFSKGNGPGIPLLEWMGLTDHRQPGSDQSATRYPVMKQWLRD